MLEDHADGHLNEEEQKEAEAQLEAEVPHSQLPPPPPLSRPSRTPLTHPPLSLARILLTPLPL